MLSFFAISHIASAVAFTASSSPTSVNAGQTELLNFTIQNIGSVNITQANITLPSGFVFSSSGTTTTGYSALSSSPSWGNTSSVGIVGNGETQYFWFYSTTPANPVNYGFNVSVVDANGVFNSTNISVNLFDILAPQYASNTTSPSTNSTYVQGQLYWINATWTDNVAVSKVLIEHNFTGSSTPHNESMNSSSSTYYLNASDIAAGNYVWRIYANDTNNTFNSTPQFTYNLNKAVSEMRIFLNGTLNGNITSINNTAVNITVNATCSQPGCTIAVSRDGTSITSGASNPYVRSDDVITTIGLHNYSVTASGNTNYTSNSSIYYAATVPRFSTSTTAPVTFSNGSSSIVFTFDNNPAFASITLQGGWSGTATNYSLTNNSATVYHYNNSFPAGASVWTLFATYSNHTFNATRGSFTINEAAPTLSLNATPQWTLDSPIQTNVTCKSDVHILTPKLYRNGTAVNNPDIQTFAAGTIYEYFCNNTVNQNYTASSQKNILYIRSTPTANIMFVEAPASVEVVQNTTKAVTIKIKNIGNVGQNVSVKLSDIDGSLFEFVPVTKDILVGQTADFVLTFNISNLNLKEYIGNLSASSQNWTIYQTLTLRIMPSNETKIELKDKLALFALEVSKLESEISKDKVAGMNVLDAEAKLEELKSKLQEAENQANSGKYFEAYQNFETIDSLITETRELLKALPQVGGTTGFSNIWIFVGVGIAVIAIGGFVVYLFLPPKQGYKPETGEYTWSGKAKEAFPKKGIFGRIKELVSKLFKREPKVQPSG